MDHHHRAESQEDQGLIFDHHNNHMDHQCPYFVQSPSTLSHANSVNIAANIDDSAFQSPTRTETLINGHNYSSSRGSNGQYFMHDKKISYDEDQLLVANSNNNRLVVASSTQQRGVDHDHRDGELEEFYEYYYGTKRRQSWWQMYCSYNNSDSNLWILLQISWRFIVSLTVALLVFYVASRPPPPKVSLQIWRIGEFELGEGVDRSGVSTKMLTFNCSLHLIIDNKSNLFALHIHPPTIQISFHHFTFAFSHGPNNMYAESGSMTLFRLWLGTKNKAMYGAGREMEDMLESGRHELPLLLRLRFASTFRVLPNLIKPKYHHQAQCLLLLRKGYDKKRRTQLFNSTCTFT